MIEERSFARLTIWFYLLKICRFSPNKHISLQNFYWKAACWRPFQQFIEKHTFFLLSKMKKAYCPSVTRHQKLDNPLELFHVCVSPPITSMWTSDQPRTTVIDVPLIKLGRTHYWVRTGFRYGDLFYQSLRFDSVQSEIIIHVVLPVIDWSEPFAGRSRLGHYQYVNERFCVSSVGGFRVAVSMADHTCLCVCDDKYRFGAKLEQFQSLWICIRPFWIAKLQT